MNRRKDDGWHPVEGVPGGWHNPNLADRVDRACADAEDPVDGIVDPVLKAIHEDYTTSIGVWKSMYYKAADERDALAARVRELEERDARRA